MPAEHPNAIAARLLEALEGLDLTSADGRAGINTLLSEIERAGTAQSSFSIRSRLALPGPRAIR